MHQVNRLSIVIDQCPLRGLDSQNKTEVHAQDTPCASADSTRSATPLHMGEGVVLPD